MIHIMLICLAYVVGIIWGLYLGVNLGIVFFCLNVCLVLIFRAHIPWNKTITAYILITFICGLFYSDFKINNFQSKYIEGETTTTLKILSFNKDGEYYSSYICKNETGDKILVYFPNGVDIHQGDTIYAKANFERPSEMRNRGGFDYSKYLYSQNIYGILKINNVDDIFIKEVGSFNLINQIQESIKNIFGNILPKDELGIMIGMIIGDTSIISEETKENFKISGITHLLAVSGSNIAYIILFTKFLFNKLLGKKISNYVVVVFLIIFMLVSGCSPSVIRATIMGIIIIFADILSKKANIYASISTSALIILIYNPLIIFDIGFILSFGGTLGIVLLYEKINSTIINKFLIENKMLIYITETLSVTLAAQIILLPIMCYSFNSISLVSILVNLLVVPISGVLTILGITTYMAGLIYLPVAKLLGYSIYIMIRIVINIAKFFSNFPYATITVITPKIIWIVIYYLLIYKMFFKVKNKILNSILIIFIIVSVLIECWPRNYLEINFVDVGQGDCTYIATRHKKTILIDGGGSEGSDYDIGENILLPYVLDRRKNKIDLIIVSHMHEDHLEGLLTIIDNLKVERILVGPVKEESDLYKKFLSITSKKGIKIDTVCEGDVVFIDDVKIEVLYPKRYDEANENENNNSLVLKLIYDDISMLFTGDIEKEAEEKIEKNTSVDILKVAHHGSKTSTTEEFINIVKPKVSLIGVGKNNNFGHPNSEVINRIYQNGSLIYRTDENGEIMIKIQDGQIKVKTLIE